MPYKPVKVGDRVFFTQEAWPNYPPNPLKGWPGTITEVVRSGVQKGSTTTFVEGDATYHLKKGEIDPYLIDGVVRVIQPENNDRDFEIFDRGSNTGLGVRVRTDIKADVRPNTFVGVYPGRVMKKGTHDRHVQKGLLNTVYTVFMFTTEPYTTNASQRNARKIKDEGFVVDPSIGPVGLDPTFANAFAPRLNEPSGTRPSNCTFVLNIPQNRIEIWTVSEIKRGGEATLCYGQTYNSLRKWTSWCRLNHIDRRYRFAGASIKSGIRRTLAPIPSPIERSYPVFNGDGRLIEWVDQYQKKKPGYGAPKRKNIQKNTMTRVDDETLARSLSLGLRARPQKKPRKSSPNETRTESESRVAESIMSKILNDIEKGNRRPVPKNRGKTQPRKNTVNTNARPNTPGNTRHLPNARTTNAIKAKEPKRTTNNLRGKTPLKPVLIKNTTNRKRSGAPKKRVTFADDPETMEYDINI